MVSNSALAALCVKYGIHQLVDTRAYGISNSLNAYVFAVTTALEEEQRASLREGRPSGQYWLRIQTPNVRPPILNTKYYLTGVRPGTVRCYGRCTGRPIPLGQLHPRRGGEILQSSLQAILRPVRDI